jgi:hypothetical protein
MTKPDRFGVSKCCMGFTLLDLIYYRLIEHFIIDIWDFVLDFYFQMPFSEFLNNKLCVAQATLLVFDYFPTYAIHYQDLDSQEDPCQYICNSFSSSEVPAPSGEVQLKFWLTKI